MPAVGILSCKTRTQLESMLPIQRFGAQCAQTVTGTAGTSYHIDVPRVLNGHLRLGAIIVKGLLKTFPPG